MRRVRGHGAARARPLAQRHRSAPLRSRRRRQPAATPPAQRFTGHPVTLDFQGADLRTVLRTFADISGLNIVIDQSVQGTVDVALHEVPWDQALDIILQGPQARLLGGRHHRAHRAADCAGRRRSRSAGS